MTRPLLIMAALLLVASTARADEPKPVTTIDRAFIPPGPKEMSRVELNQLVADLASDDAAVQRKAHEALASQLADAMPRLELLLKESKDEQVRARARAVLDDIRVRARFAPALVTLRMEDHPVAVLEEIFRQARLPMAIYPANLAFESHLKPVKVSYARRPFWTAVKEVCEASGLDVRRVYDDRHLTVITGKSPPVHGPSVVHGPMILSGGVGVEAVPGVPLRKGALQVYMTLEPRVRVVDAEITFTEVVDDAGLPLIPEAVDANRPEVRFDAEFYWQSNLPIIVPHTSRRIARARGSLKLLVQLDSETLDLPIKPKAAPVRKRIGAYDASVKGLVQTGDGRYQLALAMTRGQLDARTWKWFSHPMRRVHVLDKDGRALRVTDSGSSLGADSAECTVGFLPSDGTITERSGEPAKLVWEFPTKMQGVTVPFEFVDLPLANDGGG